jgi:hypothetical protein
LLGELRADPPPFVKRLLGWFIALGLLLIIPWGIAFAFKYGLRPFFSVLAAPAERHLGFWNYAVWFVVKVVVLIGGSRLLDGWLEGRGRGVLARVTLRTLLIWGLGLVPFPHVFGSMWGDLLAAAAPSSMIDGVIDVLGESTSDDQIFAGVMLSIGVLLALPGTHALYADVLSPPLGIIISVAFASLASRVFFMQVKYGMLTSGQTITNNQSVASSWEDSGSDD